MPATTTETERETVTDTYTRRRLLASEDELEVTINSLWKDESKLYLEVEKFEEEFFIVIPTPTDTPTETHPFAKFYTILVETFSVDISLSELQGKNLSLYLNDSFEKCYFTSRKTEGFEIQEVDTSSCELVTEDSSYTSLLDRFGRLSSQYDPYWKTEILSVKELDSETIHFAVGTGTNEHIFFKLEIDKSADPNFSPTARIIEELGGGLPKQIEGESVYLFHKDDTPSNINTITRDTQGTWDLIVQSDLDTYLDPFRSNESEEESDTKHRFNAITDLSVMGLMLVVGLRLFAEILFVSYVNLLNFIILGFCILIILGFVKYLLTDNK